MKMDTSEHSDPAKVIKHTPSNPSIEDILSTHNDLVNIDLIE